MFSGNHRMPPFTRNRRLSSARLQLPHVRPRVFWLHPSVAQTWLLLETLANGYKDRVESALVPGPWLRGGWGGGMLWVLFIQPQRRRESYQLASKPTLVLNIFTHLHRPKLHLYNMTHSDLNSVGNKMEKVVLKRWRNGGLTKAAVGVTQ